MRTAATVPSCTTAVKAAPGSSQPAKAGTIRRWAVLETGRNSVSPCTIPSTMAWKASMRPGTLPRDRPEARLEAVQVERAEGGEQRVAGAVEVGRARAEQAKLRAAARHEARLRLGVGDVERLDPVEPERREAIDGGQDVAGLVDVPERMRPHRDAARR